MEKIPCIRIDSKLIKYIEPYLIEWGYKESCPITFVEDLPLLVINVNGNFGNFTNIGEYRKYDFNRILVNNPEEFLKRAASLMGKTYKRKDIMEINDIEIKPGMVLIGVDKENKRTVLVAFPTQNGIGFATAVNSNGAGWTIDYTTRITKLKEIRDISDGTIISSGKLLWDASMEMVLTMDEIAKKFGCFVEQLRIKK